MRGYAAAEKIEVLSEERGFNIPIFAIDPEFPEYAFALRSEMEKEGAFDYHAYAAKMWTRFTGEAPEEEDRYLKSFEHGMIRDLHTIDMKKLAYPEVMESLPKLMGAWAESANKALFFSVGSGTSGVPAQFFRGILGELGSEPARKFLEKKTEYAADDGAFASLGEYLKRELGRHPGGAKVVIIEDSAGNLGRMKKSIENLFSGERVEIVPIWATYSREGHEAVRKAKTAEEQAVLWEKRHDLNAIGSFNELLGEKYAELMRGGYLLVDFDGVIGDNAEMRKRQAEAIYNNFIRAYADAKSLSIKDAEAKIRKHLGT